MSATLAAELRSCRMDDLTLRPTTEVRSVILGSMDRVFVELIGRLDGLTVDEYLWEPAPNA